MSDSRGANSLSAVGVGVSGRPVGLSTKNVKQLYFNKNVFKILLLKSHSVGRKITSWPRTTWPEEHGGVSLRNPRLIDLCQQMDLLLT